MGHTNINLEVTVQQHLELKGPLALVLDIQHRLQPILRQSHTVHQREVEGPCFACVLAQLSRREPEVKLDAVVGT